MKKIFKSIKLVYKSLCRVVSKAIKSYVNINTITLLIAILAAYISYKSLDESIKQRESMYKPDLFIGPVDFYADITDLKNIRFYYVESDTIVREERMRPWYRLNNVGMGSAISVYGHLLFNTETLMGFLSENGLTKVQLIKGDSYEDKLIFYQDTIECFNQGYISDWTVDYVLPISQSDEKSTQYFPPNVMENIIKVYLWVVKEKGDNNIGSFKIPIKLDYKDINGKWYKKEFEMYIHLANKQNKVYCLIKAGLPFNDSLRELEESINNE